MSLKKIDRRLFTILLIVFVQILGASLILPILPLYAQREFQMSPEAIALLVSSFFAAQFLAGPLIGRLSDRYGRIPVLIVSQIGTVISFIAIAFAPNFVWLFGARVLDGITGGNIIVAQAYVTDITPREERTQALGYIFAVFGLGFIFGPALGGVLSAAYGIKTPFLLAAGAAAIVVVLTWLYLDETVSAERRAANRNRRSGGLSPGQILANPILPIVLGIAFAGQFALGMLQSTFALFGEAVLFADASEETTNIGIGLLLAIVGVSQFSTQTWLLPNLIKRYREANLVVMGSVIRTAGMLVYALVSSAYLASFGSIFFAMGFGLAMPPLQSLATSAVDDSERGAVLGVYQSSVNLSTIISTAVGGFLFAIGPRIPYWTGALVSLLVILPAIILVRHTRPTPEENPAGI